MFWELELVFASHQICVSEANIWCCYRVFHDYDRTLRLITPLLVEEVFISSIFEECQFLKCIRLLLTHDFQKLFSIIFSNCHFLNCFFENVVKYCQVCVWVVVYLFWIFELMMARLIVANACITIKWLRFLFIYIWRVWWGHIWWPNRGLCSIFPLSWIFSWFIANFRRSVTYFISLKLIDTFL